MNQIIYGDCLEGMKQLESESVQLIVADPPYFQVLLEEQWDMQWKDQDSYLEWSLTWLKEASRLLKKDGLIYVFGQLGKREHVWLHLCSYATKMLQFHDMIVWDRAVGYNERYDSFTPCYEMILSLRHWECEKPYFDKDAVRLPYDEKTIKAYSRDKRYKNLDARMEHLNKGKYSTNIFRVPSLKGTSKEKAGHPSQKPIDLVEKLVLSSSRPGDVVLDPFLGSGTTAVVAEKHGRKWIGIEKEDKYIQIASKRIQEIKTEVA